MQSLSYYRNVLDSLQILRLNGQHLDVSIVLASDRTKCFRAHRCVMAAASPTLQVLFQQKTDSDTVVISDICVTAFEEILNFIYSGKLNITAETYLDILGTAEELQIQDAIQLCKDYETSRDQQWNTQEDGRDDEDDLMTALNLPNYTPVVSLVKCSSPPTVEHSEDDLPCGASRQRNKSPRRSGRKRKKRVAIRLSYQSDDGGEDEDVYEPTPKVVKKQKLAATLSGEKTPKRRGRPPKSAQSTPTKPVASAEPKRRGRVKRQPLKVSLNVDYMVPGHPCHICTYRFYQRSVFDLHQRKHGIESVYQRTLRLVRTARRRLGSLVMKNEDGAQCGKCGKVFASHMKCRAHNVKMHSRKSRCLRCTKPKVCTTSLDQYGLAHRCRKVDRVLVAPDLLRCQHCARPFKHGGIMTEHTRAHNEVAPPLLLKYQCRHCPKSITTHRSYVTHLFGHGLAPEEVDLEFKDPNRVPVRIGMALVTRDDTNPRLPYTCPYCPGDMYRYANLRAINIHLINRHNLRLLPSTKASANSLKRKAMPMKIQLEDSQRQRFEEEARTSAFPLRIQLEDSQRQRFEEEARTSVIPPRILDNKHYHCHLCSKQFVKKGSLDDHIRVTHQQMPYQCSICSKQFKSKCGLENHIREHNKDFRFLCPLCGQGFVYHSKLSSHMAQHSANTTSCPKCHKVFKHANSMQQHRLICGVLVNLYRCDFCVKSFKTKKYLAEHVAFMHTRKEDRRHVCPTCGKWYRSRSSLSDHRKRKHVTYQMSTPCTIENDLSVLREREEAEEEAEDWRFGTSCIKTEKEDAEDRDNLCSLCGLFHQPHCSL